MQLPRTPSFRLDGKRALVAGASSGIGLACAAALAEHGAHVTLSARRGDRLEEAAGAMTEQGWQVATMPLDVADTEATGKAVDGSEPFDILLNAAGLARHSPAHDTLAEDYDTVMDINVRGAYFLAQAVARKLIAADRKGSIITVSSQMGHVGGQDRAVYCASKHAVEGFTKAMAIEWGPHGIRINTICPTFILTDLTRPTFENPEKRRLGRRQDQARTGRYRGRGYHGWGSLSGVRPPHRLSPAPAYSDRRRLDGGLMVVSKVTSNEVAKRAGCQPVRRQPRLYTRAHRHPPRRSRKVRKAAQELGYRPNVLARAMVSGKSRIIGLVVAYLENQFYPVALELLSNALQERGYHILIFHRAELS